MPRWTRREIAAGRQRWQQRYDAAAVRDADFTHAVRDRRSSRCTGRPTGPTCPGFERIGWPGEFPYTRGLYPTGYRGRTWTIRQFAGFGNAQQTNERYKMILGAGGGGLSVAFDMPTLMGRDSDEPQSLGEVGHCGVAIDSAADMDVLFGGIDLAAVTTSMTISGPAVPIFCMYLVAAERQGADLSKLDGTLQTDIFKEYIAQKEWLFAPAAAPAPDRRPDGVLRRRDPEVQAAVGLRLPHPGGRFDRRAGAGVHAGRRFRLRGAGPVARPRREHVRARACRFFFDAHVDFFEEIAKFRAARRIWARWLRDVYGATDEKALWLRVPHPDRRASR